MGKGSSAFADGDCRTPLCGGGNGLACWKKKMAAVAYVFAALAFALELAMLPVYIATGFIKTFLAAMRRRLVTLVMRGAAPRKPLRVLFSQLIYVIIVS